MITLGLVANVDTSGVYVSMPGARGVLRGPYEATVRVVVGERVLLSATDDGDTVVAGVVGGANGVTPESFGAKGDGVSDDTVAVRAAFDAARLLRTQGLGGNIFRPGVTVTLTGVYNLASLTQPLIASCNVDAAGATLVVPNVYDDVVLLAGHETSGKVLHNARMALPGVIRVGATALPSGSVGVRVQNLTHSEVQCGRVTHHETGLHVTGLGQGSVYNRIHIGWIDLCKVAIDLRPLSGGWSNQNTYVGGGVTQSPNTLDGGTTADVRRAGWRHVVLDGSSGSGTVNTNTFVGVSFEGDLSEYHLDFTYATNNTFVGCRHEQGTAPVAASISGDTFTTSDDHHLTVGDAVVFLASGTPALGLLDGAVHWVAATPADDTFKVSKSEGGPVLTPGSAGSGIVFYRVPAVRFDGTDGNCHDNNLSQVYSYPGPLRVVRENNPVGNVVSQPQTAYAGYGKGDLMPGRNRIVNGDFRINQRAYTSGTNLTSAGTFTFDRWKTIGANTALTFTAAPNGQPVTLATGKGIRQIVERGNVEPGVYTLSWRGTALGRVYRSGDSAPTALPSPVTVALDGTTDVVVEIEAGASSADVVDVQLERGAWPTPFERVPLGAALLECRRYFLRFGHPSDGPNLREPIGVAAVFDSTYAWMSVTFPVPMRAAPTLTVTGTYLRLVSNSAVAYWDTASLPVSTKQSARVQITSSGLTGGDAMLVDTGDYNAYVDFSAEL